MNSKSEIPESAPATGDEANVRPLIVLGTRPEAIKLAPVIKECLRRKGEVTPIVCSTGQHREMLDQVMRYFEIEPDIDLGLMKPRQTLQGLTAACLESVSIELERYKPDCVVVQGDTTTVFAAATAAFYQHVPVVHIEAGLRTGDLSAPWPEEFNRRATGIVTDLHCAPTDGAAAALRREHVPDDKLRVTGNTVVDALMYTALKERAEDEKWLKQYPAASAESVVLITGHRRENFGEGLQNICSAIVDVAIAFPETQFIYPVHLNPNVRGPVHEMLSEISNIHLVPPADYPQFVWLMDRASVVLTDSGGVQEEAPSLGAAVLVTREKTERPEAVQAGLAELVGTDRELIVQKVSEALKASSLHPRTEDFSANPYGDGKASERIVDWIVEAYHKV